jgi:hypothetical protein
MQCGITFSVLESNLLAMGFEKSAEGATATLPRKMEKHSAVENVCQSLKDVDARHHPSIKLETERTVSIKFVEPEVVTVSKKKVATLPVVGSVTTSDTASPNANSRGLYGLIKEQVQMARNSSSSALQSKTFGSTTSSASTPDLTERLQHMPAVYFCEAKNTVISASSSEDISCR